MFKVNVVDDFNVLFRFILQIIPFNSCSLVFRLIAVNEKHVVEGLDWAYTVPRNFVSREVISATNSDSNSIMNNI